MPRQTALPAALTAEAAIVLLLVPLITFPRGWLPIAAIALPALWLADRPRWWTFGTVPWLPLLVLLAAAALVSTYFAADPSAAVGKLLALLLGIATVITVSRLRAAGLGLDTALVLFLGAGSALALTLLVGTNWFDKWPAAADLADRVPKLIRGLRGAEAGFHPNAGAGALLLFFPTALQAALGKGWSSGVRSVGRVAAIGIGVVLVLTQSRSALVGLAAGLALTGLLTAADRSRQRLRVAAGAGGAFALVILALFLTAPELLERIAGPHLRTGLSSRAELWDRTIAVIGAHPWAGLGFNGFRNQIQAEQPLFLLEPSERPPHAHNQFLQTAVDLGIVGFAIYASVLLAVVTQLSRTARTGVTSQGRAAAAALLGGLLSHLVFGMTDAIPLGTKVGFAFWLAIGFAAVVARERPGPS